MQFNNKKERKSKSKEIEYRMLSEKLAGILEAKKPGCIPAGDGYTYFSTLDTLVPMIFELNPPYCDFEFDNSYVYLNFQNHWEHPNGVSCKHNGMKKDITSFKIALIRMLIFYHEQEDFIKRANTSKSNSWVDDELDEILENYDEIIILNFSQKHI